jgi:hypothetical protein
MGALGITVAGFTVIEQLAVTCCSVAMAGVGTGLAVCSPAAQAAIMATNTLIPVLIRHMIADRKAETVFPTQLRVLTNWYTSMRKGKPHNRLNLPGVIS